MAIKLNTTNGSVTLDAEDGVGNVDIELPRAGFMPDSPVSDENITESSVTQHEAALSITESQISDLQSYLTAETNDLTSAVTWANVPDANITESSVTQHQAALSITESQISDLQSYLTSETNDLTAAVTWANVPDANITESSVTQHEAALSITESQISDLQSYLTSETTTSLTADSVNERLVYTDETGTVNNIDISWAVDDTNLSRITSGTVDGVTGIATFTRDDATTFTVDFSDLFDDTNLTRITSASFASGTLTLTRSDATTVTVDLDGRYLQSISANSVGITELDVTDGTNGQVLTTNGSGTLSFSTISGYTDSDVDTHLNTSSATEGTALFWNGSDYSWGSANSYSDSDVDAHLNRSTAASGEVLSWNGSDYEWVESGGSTFDASLFHTLDNPNAYNTSASDLFGWSVAVSGNYAIVGAFGEDDSGGNSSGKAYIYNVTNGVLVHTLDDPNAYSTSNGDNFGHSVAISGNYAIVGAPQEDDSGGTGSGKAYIFNVTTGDLVHTLDNPNAYDTSASDNFGHSVGISGNYAIVSAKYEDDSGGSASGKAYIFNVTTGALVHTLDNPNAYDTSASDNFGQAVAISGNYAIVSANGEAVAGSYYSGAAYIFNVTTGDLVHTLDNPNDYGTSTDDWFGFSVGISGNYAIVSAKYEDESGATSTGRAYIFNVSTGALLHTLDNPNGYDTSDSDLFGQAVSISGDYAIVCSMNEDELNTAGTGTAYNSGKAYIFSAVDGSLVATLDNANAYDSPDNDQFAYSVGISGNYAIVGAPYEDEASGTSSGKAYIYQLSAPAYAPNADEVNSFLPETNVEIVEPKASATGTVAHDISTAAVFRHTSISSNFTANFTNAVTTSDRTTSVALILVQGSTAYMPTAVQIDGVGYGLLWQGGSAPSGTANGTDVVSFTLIRSGSSWSVIGSATSYS